MNPKFIPKRPDGRSAGQVVLEYIARRMKDGSLNDGDIIPHSELLAELEMSEIASSYYQAITRGTRLLQQQYNRSLISIRNAGYQLITGMAMADKSRTVKRRGEIQIGNSLDVVRAIDTSTLPREYAHQVDVIISGMTNLFAIVRLQAERLAEHDEEIRTLRTARIEDRAAAITYTDDETATLKARLDAIERKLAG